MAEPDAPGLVLDDLLRLHGGRRQFLLIAAFARSEASLLAPFGYSTLVWAALFGIVIFGNFPESMTILGAGIVVLAGL